MVDERIEFDDTLPLVDGKPMKDMSAGSEDGVQFEDMYDRTTYWIMMLLGAGLLLPWNVCLNSLDYLGHNYTINLSYYVTLAYVYPQLPLLAIMVKVRGFEVEFAGEGCDVVYHHVAVCTVGQSCRLYGKNHCNVLFRGRWHADHGGVRTSQLLDHAWYSPVLRLMFFPRAPLSPAEFSACILCISHGVHHWAWHGGPAIKPVWVCKPIPSHLQPKFDGGSGCGGYPGQCPAHHHKRFIER